MLNQPCSSCCNPKHRIGQLRPSNAPLLFGMILIGAVLMAPGAEASADNVVDAGRIQRALDQPIQLELKEIPLAQAAQQISRRSGIEIEITDQAFALLPYAKGTRVTVTFGGCSAGQGLETLCDQLGLDFEITAQRVLITPSAPLRRIGRRAQWSEIRTLSDLTNTRWLTGDQEFVGLKDRIQFHTGITDNPVDWKMLAHAIANVGGGDADEVLSAACNSIGCTWFPSGESIIILPRSEQLKRRLAMPVSLEFARKSLAEVLAALSRQIDAPIYLDPSATALTSRDIRDNFTLVVEGVSAIGALNQVALVTGLGYRIDDEAITFFSEPGARPANRSQWRGDRVVGRVIAPSSDGEFTYEFFIRESDLTPEENDRRKAKIRRAIESMKRDLTP